MFEQRTHSYRSRPTHTAKAVSKINNASTVATRNRQISRPLSLSSPKLGDQRTIVGASGASSSDSSASPIESRLLSFKSKLAQSVRDCSAPVSSVHVSRYSPARGVCASRSVWLSIDIGCDDESSGRATRGFVAERPSSIRCAIGWPAVKLSLAGSGRAIANAALRIAST